MKPWEWACVLFWMACGALLCNVLWASNPFDRTGLLVCGLAAAACAIWIHTEFKDE